MTYWSAALRADLSRLAAAYAGGARVASYRSLGREPVTLFPRAQDGSRHGNFHPSSFSAITADADWAARLKKPHTRRGKALPSPHDSSACELDSCTSSDALLMNVLCYPGVVAGAVAQLLGVTDGARPRFGVPGVVPLNDGTRDATEIDAQIGETNIEAKLTEPDFISRPFAHVERYAGFYEVFEREALPRTDKVYLSYQLIRNVLAVAHRPTARLRVLLDGRRPDLLREWWTLHGAIRQASLRQRCGFVLWQELAAVSPTTLREFLAKKYGL
jgi:hypothetical protein